MEFERGSERWLLDMADVIVAAGLDPSLWPEVLRRMAEGCPGVQGAMLLLHSDAADAQTCIRSVQHGFDPEWMRDYERYYSRINPWVPVMHRQPVLRAGVTNDTLPWWTFADSEFYNDFMKRAGESECGAGIKLFDGADRSAFLTMQYGSTVAAHYDRVLPQVLQRLAPAFRAAIRLNREMALNAAATAAEIFQALTVPAFAVDESCVVRSANALGASAADRGDLLRLDVAGRLRLCDSAAGGRLVLALRRLCRTGEEMSGSIALRSCDGETAAMLSIFPISGTAATGGQNWLLPPERLALVTIRPLTRRPMVAEDTLRHLFCLTAAEARLAARLARGDRLSDSAEALGIARETARVHLRAVFAKTGTHRQAELVALLAGLARAG